MLFYGAALSLSSSTPTYVGSLIRHRLNLSLQALLILVRLCKGETYAELAAGICVATACGM
ncbi:hypothetical protein [Streptosporangium saharense]|uniref:hypothetical protein n=1 Tax=Streptosporangium saharense TaxID=1706840 RepID=UPI003429AD87